ncbi:MAG: hypothetical protein A2Y62_21060 [Candidatus Fischerbacteria bacterium RBG_13_37_8]|uniref:Uncharacterized protein n=1 Tax=Candidatus Fischerbacteria bacterium RBG_13_37_8 TaxID=1817863 RepID=A0A1F5V6E8_9BACT|nr:MAG: hypothetical protein A2Y62_21060 [Candidatus Fischerbacteria bacterium RBG_13_37_8]
MIEVTIMEQKHIWALKNRDERKAIILDILEKNKKITMVDLIKNHHQEIGIALPPSGKIIHQSWELVRNDCKSLAKEERITMAKDKTGRIILRILKEKRVSIKKAEPVEQETVISEEEVSMAPIETREVIDIIQQLTDKVSAMRTEVMEIWKYVAKISAQEIIDELERETIINTLQDVIDKLKLKLFRDPV